MKKFAVMMLAAALLAAVNFPASARPPYKPIFDGAYPNLKEAAAEAKCNVCHMGTEKKNRNEYGVALSKVITKAKFDELKGDKEALEAAVKEALKKVESEKSSGGKTFGELIKAGELPGGK